MTTRGFLVIMAGIAAALATLAGIAWLLWGSSRVAYGAVVAGEDPARWGLVSSDRVGGADLIVVCDRDAGRELVIVNYGNGTDVVMGGRCE